MLARVPVVTAAAGALLALAGLVGVVSPAAADPEADAKALAAEARPLAETGVPENLAEAIRLYKRAYALDPHPVYLCNAGVAYQLLDDLPRAHALLSACLERLPAVQPGAVALFRRQLDAVEAALPDRHLAVDVVTEPAGATLTISTLADDEPVVAPTVAWLPAGTHTIAATAPGHVAATEEVTVTADEIATRARRGVRLVLPAEERAAPAPTVVEKVVERPVPRAGGGRRTAAWISLGAGGALLAGGGVMHAITYRTRDRLAGLSGDAYDDELPTFRTQRAVTLSLYGVGAAAAITGAVLLYLAPRHADRVAVAPAPAGDGAVVWIDLAP